MMILPGSTFCFFRPAPLLGYLAVKSVDNLVGGTRQHLQVGLHLRDIRVRGNHRYLVKGATGSMGKTDEGTSGGMSREVLLLSADYLLLVQSKLVVNPLTLQLRRFPQVLQMLVVLLVRKDREHQIVVQEVVLVFFVNLNGTRCEFIADPILVLLRDQVYVVVPVGSFVNVVMFQLLQIGVPEGRVALEYKEVSCPLQLLVIAKVQAVNGVQLLFCQEPDLLLRSLQTGLEGKILLMYGVVAFLSAEIPCRKTAGDFSLGIYSGTRSNNLRKPA